MATFDDFYQTLHPDSRIRGKQFEKFVKWFLKTDPRWENQVKDIWLWEEHPLRSEWGPDCGVDLVFEHVNGECWAVQAKCFAPSNAIKKEDMNSFIAESIDSRFQKRLLVTTTNLIGPNVDRLLERHQVVRILLDDLVSANVEYPVSPQNYSNAKRKDPLTPRLHQKVAIKDVCQRLINEDRGQVLMACGTGKTLTALWIKEKLQAENVLVLLPSLSLLSQTLNEWHRASQEPFKWICVCSDKTVAKKDKTEDDWITNTSEIGLPVTSDIKDIQKFLKEEGQKIIFSTYQSSQLIVAVHKNLKIPDFDIIFADEAHRCAGKVSDAFGSVLDNTKIRSKKRLFLTATPRILTSQVKGQAKSKDIEVASMDDVSQFGDIFHKLNFSDAIKREPPLLSDYQVVVVGVDEPMINQSIMNRDLLTTDGKNVIDAEILAAMIALAKSIKTYKLKRLITFHGTVKKARHLSEEFVRVVNIIPSKDKPQEEIECDYVYGKMKSKIRNEKIQKLKNISNKQIKILSNARCLSEGVDVPVLDGIAFIDPKRSQVDIVQAVGRAIRLSKKKQPIGTIVIPVFLGDTASIEDEILASKFADVWKVILALKDQDDSLSEIIDTLRIQLGKKGELTKQDKKGLIKIIFDLPSRVNKSFVNSLTTILVKNASENWLEMYGKLEEYTIKHGEARPPIDKSALGNWVQKQRYWFLKNKLSKKRIELLNKLNGWIWEAYEAYWFEKYDLLKIYFEKYKHSNVRQDDGILGKWVQKQRTENNKNKLSNEKKILLNKLNFVWDAKDARWMMKYELLKEYSEKKGHANPPAREKIIGSWVSNLRSVYMRKKENRLRYGEENTLTNERIRLLECLPGWTWDPLENEWIKNYNQLEKELKSEVSFKFSNLPQDLASWTSRQISNFNNLSNERKNLLQKLENIGLRLETKSEYAQKEWVRSIEYFFQENNHLVIPKTSEFSNIANMIRGAYKKKTLHKSTLKRLKELEAVGWMWEPALEISLEKIEFLKEWCIKNDSLDPPRDLIIMGNNKTYINDPRKSELDRRKFNLGIFISQLKARYKYTKFESNPTYEKEFDGAINKQIRVMTDDEIIAVESIRVKDGFWYWEPFDGYLRVYKECFKRNIQIKQKTCIDFDLVRFRNIGRWIQTVHTANKRGTLHKYNFDKLKDLPGNHFQNLIFNEKIKP